MRMRDVILATVVLVTACAEPGANRAPELVVLTPEVAGYDDVARSPDGSQIAYTRRENPDNEAVWVAEADGSNARRVTAFTANVSEPSWSPDGTTVLYQAFDRNTQSAVLSTVPAQGGEPTRLVEAGVVMYGFRYSPDGTRILFVSDFEGSIALRTIASGGGVPVVLVPRRVTRPRWSPDGSRIAMTDRVGDSSFVAVVELDTGELRRLTTEGVELFEDWSPDGSGIAYMSRRSGQADIWALDLATGTPRQLTVDVRDDTQPSYSPDGKWLAYNSERGGQDDIWILPVAGGASIRVTNDPAEEGRPFWDPDGRGLYFFTSDQVNHLFAAPATGGTLRQITVGEEDNQDPRISPDGRTVAFEGERGGLTGIYTVPIGGGEERPVAVGTDYFDPAWSPDGSRLAFVSIREGRRGIWTASPDGGEQQRVTPEEIDGFEPLWHPDGERILFHTNAAGGERKVMIAPATGGDESLFIDMEQVGQERWSPAGQHLLFRHRNVAAGRNEVYVMPAGGGTATYLTAGQNATDATWSVDGSRIAYAAVSPEEGQDVYVMAADGSNKTRVTTDPAADFAPNFLASDEKIWFVTSRKGKLAFGVFDFPTGTVDFPYDFDLLPSAADLSRDRSTIVIQARAEGNKIVAVDVSDLLVRQPE